LSEIINVHVNVTYGCYSQSKYENIEWDNECVCKCYIWVLFSILKVYMRNIEWKILGEIMNVYVNVTYGCSQSKYENIEW
jgi:hypothetical protein